MIFSTGIGEVVGRHKNIETKTKDVETMKDKTGKFGSRLISEYWSRPRFIETEKFYKY